jgi:transcriptional regulator with XRE-family HTH domain
MNSEQPRMKGRRLRHTYFDPAKLRRRRFEAGFTQGDLADRAGISVSTLSGYERGYRSPTARCLGRVAEALSCNPADLMKDVTDKAAA